MAVTEGLKLVFSGWFFLRGFLKAVMTYCAERKRPISGARIRGRNMADTLPEQLPSVVDIRRVVPKHCFTPSTATSLYYAAKDCLQVAAAYFIIYYLHQAIPNTTFYWVSMALYWAVQGTFFTAIFVCGHDCGHGSFSRHALLNDVTGTFLHGFLLVPYYQWKLSHHHHHRFTGNFDKDEVYYPVKDTEKCARSKVLPAFGFGVAWFAYLVKGYSPRAVSHLTASAAMFSGHVIGCTLSLLHLAAMTSLLYLYYSSHGLAALVCYYVVPEFVFASFIIVITFLHHSELNIPWYADRRWSFVRGQLSTIDRHYGFVHRVIHNIGTHQIHHMFYKIPHYHLEEATAAFRVTYPALVRVCDEPIMTSYLRMTRRYREQVTMPADTETFVYT